MALDDDFDTAFARAVTAGLLSEAELDTITDSIAAGQATERNALCEWWPEMEVAFGQDFPWQPTPPTTLPQTFSLAEARAHYVHPRWARLKNRGNEALAAGEFNDAYTWYSRAIGVCDCSAAITTLFKLLEGAAEGSGALRLHAAEDDIAPLLLEHMSPCIRSWDVWVPGTPETSGGVAMAVEPNLPLATCYANRAAVGLKMAEALASDQGKRDQGKRNRKLRESILRDALLDAECAREACPEYLKGHFRAGQALRALGGREAEAAQLDKAAETFKLGVEHLPWYALALVSIGWLDVISLERVYQPAFERHVLARIAANNGRDAHGRARGVTVFASLVPSSLPACGSASLSSTSPSRARRLCGWSPRAAGRPKPPSAGGRSTASTSGGSIVGTPRRSRRLRMGTRRAPPSRRCPVSSAACLARCWTSGWRRRPSSWGRASPPTCQRCLITCAQRASPSSLSRGSPERTRRSSRR